MTNPVLQTLELVKQQVAELESELRHKQRMANDLCSLAGIDPLYRDTERTASRTSMRPDQFYGRPLATVAREALLMLGHATTVKEIYDLLVKGGYAFEAKGEENAKRSLRISLSKNSTAFHKLPNGTYGLVDWYDGIKAGTSEKKDATRNGGTFHDEVPPKSEEEFGAADDDDHARLEAAKAIKG